MQRVGDILHEERTLKGVSLEEVSRHTRIRTAFLSALEQSDYDYLPAIGHTKGFVISYAQYLGLDANELAVRIAAELNGKEQEKSRGAFDRARQTDRTSTDTHEIPWKLVWVLIIAALVIGAIALAMTTLRTNDGRFSIRPQIRTMTTDSGLDAEPADDAIDDSEDSTASDAQTTDQSTPETGAAEDTQHDTEPTDQATPEGGQ